jgi:hypothetical protein
LAVVAIGWFRGDNGLASSNTSLKGSDSDLIMSRSKLYKELIKVGRCSPVLDGHACGN